MSVQMKLWAAILCMIVVTSGCVSMPRYRLLEKNSNEYKETMGELQTDKDNLIKANEELSQRAADLEKRSQESKAQYENVVNQLKKEVQMGQITVTTYKNMLKVDVAEKIFFDSGSATLKESGKEVLSKVGEALKPLEDKIIRVIGHTDNVPIAGSLRSKFPTNWELSVIRATNVVRFLQDKAGINPERLVAIGRGEYEPIAPNDTPENKQKNRRIEIMLIDKKVQELMEQGKTEETQSPAQNSEQNPAPEQEPGQTETP